MSLVYVGVGNDRCAVVLWGGYACLEAPIAAHAHQMTRPHHQDGVGVANAGSGQWLGKLHLDGDCDWLLKMIASESYMHCLLF